MAAKKKRIKIIGCLGAQLGRSLVYGEVDEVPTPGQPVTIYDARMILRYEAKDERRGLFGIAAKGPPAGTRITCRTAWTVATCQEALAVSAEAQERLDSWPDA